jgi:predicted XRE-type DNA-binding protein
MPKKITFLTDAELMVAIGFAADRVRGGRSLPKDTPCVDRIKYDLCKQLVFYMEKRGLSQRQFAKKLGVSESRISEIVHFKIEKITIDKLVEFLERLNCATTIKVA